MNTCLEDMVINLFFKTLHGFFSTLTSLPVLNDCNQLHDHLSLKMSSRILFRSFHVKISVCIFPNSCHIFLIDFESKHFQMSKVLYSLNIQNLCLKIKLCTEIHTTISESAFIRQ